MSLWSIGGSPGAVGLRYAWQRKTAPLCMAPPSNPSQSQDTKEPGISDQDLGYIGQDWELRSGRTEFIDAFVRGELQSPRFSEAKIWVESVAVNLEEKEEKKEEEECDCSTALEMVRAWVCTLWYASK